MVLSLSLAAAGCDAAAPVAPGTSRSPDAEWETASPAQVGLDSVALARMAARLRAGELPNLHSLLIVRRGRLVHEQYFAGQSADEPHTLQSVSKTVTSLLVGIALQQGAIRSVDQRVLDFLPEYRSLPNLDPRTRDLTLEDVLTMRTGFRWHESPYAGSPLERLNNSTSDWLRFMLELPMQEEPGTRFNYNTGSTLLLAGVIGKATGMRADSFAVRHLFEPLGIGAHRWIHGYPNGLPHTGGGLYLRPRDMARLGQLVLNGGSWNGRQVVSREWLRASTARVVRRPWSFGEHRVDYGYLWWIADLNDPMGGLSQAGDVWVAAGSRGQWIFVVPSHDLVMVATGWDHGDDWIAPLDLLYTTVLRAAR